MLVTAAVICGASTCGTVLLGAARAGRIYGGETHAAKLPDRSDGSSVRPPVRALVRQGNLRMDAHHARATVLLSIGINRAVAYLPRSHQQRSRVSPFCYM